jgi:Protein of unknown function (DUF2911)
MKGVQHLMLWSLILSFVVDAKAQLLVPGATPSAKSEVVVGLTTIALDYSRPSKLGRKIFGGLVRYDTIWRTGANKNTKITFSDDVIVGGIGLKQGTYAIFSKPSKTLWEVYFYQEYNHWGANFGVPENWDTAKIAAKVIVKPMTIPVVETFSINVENIDYEDCVLEIKWDNVCIPIKIEVPTDKKVSENMERLFKGPDVWDYYRAAIHHRRAKKDLNQALIWIDKAIEIGDIDLYCYRQKSLIEADMGNYAAALISANKSLQMAKEEGDQEYVKLNADSIDEWANKVKSK